jgi:hypothetical protein
MPFSSAPENESFTDRNNTIIEITIAGINLDHVMFIISSNLKRSNLISLTFLDRLQITTYNILEKPTIIDFIKVDFIEFGNPEAQ